MFDWYEHPLLTLAAAMLLPLPAILPWDKWLKLKPSSARIGVALLVAVAVYASLRMVDGWSGRLDGAVAGWGMATLVIGILVIGWRWAYVAVLALLMIGVGGWNTVQESFTGDRCAAISASIRSPIIRRRDSGGWRMARPCTASSAPIQLTGARRRPITARNRGSGWRWTRRRRWPDRMRRSDVGLGRNARLLSPPRPAMDDFRNRPGDGRHRTRPRQFTFLSDCAPDAPIVIGDARLKIAEQAAGRFDILVIDAFSSDAIRSIC